MTSRLGRTQPVEESIQATFTDKKIKDKLEGYKKLPNKDFCNLKPGDNIRYSINSEFRGGGTIKLVKFPTYLVCLNVIKNISWSVQLTDPTLIVWVKTKEAQDKIREEKKKVYEMYKAKKLVHVSKCK